MSYFVDLVDVFTPYVGILRNFTKAANMSKSLSQFLFQNWTGEFEQTLHELRAAIVQINSTCLDLSFTEGLSSWISSAVSYFKKWVGVGLFGAVICCGIVFLLWLVCKLRIQNKRDKVMIAQALVAIEQGASTDIWLSMLKHRLLTEQLLHTWNSGSLHRVECSVWPPKRGAELRASHRELLSLKGMLFCIRVACLIFPFPEKNGRG